MWFLLAHVNLTSRVYAISGPGSPIFLILRFKGHASTSRAGESLGTRLGQFNLAMVIPVASTQVACNSIMQSLDFCFLQTGEVNIVSFVCKINIYIMMVTSCFIC